MHESHLAKTRITDNRSGGHMVRVQPGEYFVTDDPHEMISTVLGSCVAACVRNPFTGFGGMNHFMLPESEAGQWGGVSAVMRYGNHAMETLINAVLKSGCRREDLEIKLFGGANMYEGSSAVGAKNARFAIEYLRNEGLRLAVSDLGGSHGRRIHYLPGTGKVKRLMLTATQADGLSRREIDYRSHMATSPVEGDIELFR